MFKVKQWEPFRTLNEIHYIDMTIMTRIMVSRNLLLQT